MIYAYVVGLMITLRHKYSGSVGNDDFVGGADRRREKKCRKRADDVGDTLTDRRTYGRSDSTGRRLSGSALPRSVVSHCLVARRQWRRPSWVGSVECRVNSVCDGDAAAGNDASHHAGCNRVAFNSVHVTLRWIHKSRHATLHYLCKM